MSIKQELIEHYSNKSKHSNYQVLPGRLKKILAPTDVQTKTRFEKERLNYLLEQIDFKDKSVLDIGGNTGYFSFELLDAGARSVHCIEGNKDHAEFVELAAKALKLDDKLQVTNDYLTFDGSYTPHFDVILLFNVLHHVGDDYGDNELAPDKVRQAIARQLNSLNKNTDIMVFQMGFNWKGDTTKSIFKDGTKAEMIEFVKTAAEGNWDIISIGVAERIDGKIAYRDLDGKNIKRDDSLGEFLNRPIFIMKPR